jgi:hypothetical protein
MLIIVSNKNDYKKKREKARKLSIILLNVPRDSYNLISTKLQITKNLTFQILGIL